MEAESDRLLDRFLGLAHRLVVLSLGLTGELVRLFNHRSHQHPRCGV